MELWYSRAFHDSFYMFSEYLGCGRYGRIRTLLDIDMTHFISDLHFASGNYRGGGAVDADNATVLRSMGGVLADALPVNWV